MSKIAYLARWTEFERGWGSRPDGYSLHRSIEEFNTYIASYRAGLPRAVPDEYSEVTGNPVAVEIDDELANMLQRQPSLRFWQSQLEVHTGPTGGRSACLAPSEKPPCFVDACLRNLAKPEDFDGYVEKWHAGAGKGQELASWLGFTAEEYARVLVSHDALIAVLFERARAALGNR